MWTKRLLSAWGVRRSLRIQQHKSSTVGTFYLLSLCVTFPASLASKFWQFYFHPSQDSLGVVRSENRMTGFYLLLVIAEDVKNEARKPVSLEFIILSSLKLIAQPSSSSTTMIKFLKQFSRLEMSQQTFIILPRNENIHNFCGIRWSFLSTR